MSAGSTSRAGRTAVAAVALGVAATSWLAVWPCFYTGVASDSTGGVRTRRVCDTLIGENGTWVIGLLLVPVGLSLLALLAVRTGKRGVAWTCGVVMVGLCILAAFSIGIFYLPCAIAVLAAAAMMPASSREVGHH